MSNVIIGKYQDGFYDRYGDNMVAFLEDGQSLKIKRVMPRRKWYEDTPYLCSVINPTDACIEHGGYHGMLVLVYEEHIELK